MLKFGENAKSSEKNRIFASKRLAYEEIHLMCYSIAPVCS